MDVLVLLEECDDEAAGRPSAPDRARAAGPVAYVHWTPAEPQAAAWGTPGAGGRDVITLCAPADADRFALALAAAVEGRRAGEPGPLRAVRHLGVWPGAGAAGDMAWRDRETGQLMSRDLDISADTVEATARRLLAACGGAIRQTVAKLAMPDWPEGVRRAITFTLPAPADLAPAPLALAGVGAGADGLLASLREAGGYEVGDDDDELA